MNFSYQRFTLLLHAHWVEHRKPYLWAIPAMALLLTIAMIMFTPFAPGAGPSRQLMVFQAGLVLLNGFFTSSFIVSGNDRAAMTQWLLLPASSFEKLMLAVLFTNVLFPVVYFAVAFAASRGAFWYDTDLRHNLNEPLRLTGIGGLLLLNSVIQAFLLAASLIFRKQRLVKSVLVMGFLVIGTYYLNAAIAGAMIRDTQPSSFSEVSRNFLGRHTRPTFRMGDAAPYDYLRFTRTDQGTNEPFRVELPAAVAERVSMSILLLVPFFWFLAAVRLREKSIG